MPNEETASPGWLTRVMSSGLVGPDEVRRLMAGDFSALVQVLPQLLSDPEFAAIPEIQGMLAAMGKKKGAEGVPESATPRQRVENGAAERAHERDAEPQVAADVPFDALGDAFGTRLCALLASPKLGGQIQINAQVTSRGVVFQLLRHVEGEDGPEIIPFSTPVKSAPRTLGRWLKATLAQASSELRQMIQDEEALEDEGPESAPPERSRERQPRG